MHWFLWWTRECRHYVSALNAWNMSFVRNRAMQAVDAHVFWHEHLLWTDHNFTFFTRLDKKPDKTIILSLYLTMNSVPNQLPNVRTRLSIGARHKGHMTKLAAHPRQKQWWPQGKSTTSISLSYSRRIETEFQKQKGKKPDKDDIFLCLPALVFATVSGETWLAWILKS